MVKVFLTKEILHQSPRSPMLAWKKSNQKLFDLFNCNNQATVKKLLNITDKYQEIYVTHCLIGQSDLSPGFQKSQFCFVSVFRIMLWGSSLCRLTKHYSLSFSSSVTKLPCRR